MYPKPLICGFLLVLGLHGSRSAANLIEDEGLLNMDSRLIWSREVNGSWQCGAGIHLTVRCADDSDIIKIPRCYCMFYDDKANQTQLGYCVTTCFHKNRTLYIPLKRYSMDNGSQLNQDMCSENVASFVTNRMGRFCGRCKEGFGIDANKKSKCIPCRVPHPLINWLKYFGISLVPLAVIYFILVITKVNIINSKLNGIIFNMQILLSSTILGMAMSDFLRTDPASPSETRALFAVELLFEPINLNFVQDFYPPLCLGPQFSALHIIALDYVVALFPFVLILLSYILIKLYDRNVTLLVWLWKPFKFLFDYFFADMSPQTSLVETFASFILLSSVKILAISLAILSYVDVYDEQGKRLKQRYLYVDANIEFFGREHLPFAFLALTVCSIFIILPLFLQLLYPCMFFQKFLNYCGWNSQVLRVFMDAFQGSYSTEPYDMRYFSAFYVFARLVLLFIISFIHNYLQVCAFYIVVFVLLGTIVAIAQPYRVSAHNKLDVVTNLMSTLLCVAILLHSFLEFFDYRLKEVTAGMFTFTLTIVALYFFGILTWGLLGENLKVLFQKILCKLRPRMRHLSTLIEVANNREDCNEEHHSNECSNLLQN